jgi:hypothetical protein
MNVMQKMAVFFVGRKPAAPLKPFTADEVSILRDATNLEVLGADGFWAAKRGDVWSDKFTSWIEPPEGDRVLITDLATATAISIEARTAMKHPMTSPTRERVGTPEQQKAIDEWRAQLGQALVDNLNRNVLKKRP